MIKKTKALIHLLTLITTATTATFKKHTLSQLHNNSKVIKFQASPTSLTLITYSPTSSSCVLSFFYSLVGSITQTYPLSLSECQRLKITNLNNREPKLLSYVSEKGNFAWQILDQFSKFEDFSFLKNFNLYEANGLSPFVDYEVVKPVHRWDKYTEFFVLASKASDKDGNYPGEMFMLDSNSSRIGLNNNSILTLKKSKLNFSDFFENLENVHSVNWQSDSGKYILSGIWVCGGQQSEGASGSESARVDSCKYARVDSNFFYDGDKPTDLEWTYFEGMVVSGVINYSDKIDWYYEINPLSGRFKLCSPEENDFEKIIRQNLFERKCGQIVNENLKFEEKEEYVGSVGVRKADSVSLVKIRSKKLAEVGEWREVFLNLNQADVPEIDTEKFYYAVGEEGLFQIGKELGSGEDLVFYADMRTVGEDGVDEMRISL
jgi:hypothetical protein